MIPVFPGKRYHFITEFFSFYGAVALRGCHAAPCSVRSDIPDARQRIKATLPYADLSHPDGVPFSVKPAAQHMLAGIQLSANNPRRQVLYFFLKLIYDLTYRRWNAL